MVWFCNNGLTIQPFDSPTWQIRQLGGETTSFLCHASATSSSCEALAISIRIPGHTYPWYLENLW